MHLLDLVCFDPDFQFDLVTMRRFALARNAIVMVAESAEDETALAGFVILETTRRRGQQTAYIVTLDVAPDYRRAGLARMLLHDGEQAAASSGAHTVWLHVFRENTAAIRFYEAVGYEYAGWFEGFYGPGLDALVYAKSITA